MDIMMIYGSLDDNYSNCLVHIGYIIMLMVELLKCLWIMVIEIMMGFICLCRLMMQ